MATKNIVPRANNEGELGTSSKKWNKVNATTITATSFVGNGSSITGVTAEWDGSHTGNATIAGNLSASLNVSSSGFYAQRLKLVNESSTTKGEVTWDSGGMHLKGDRVHFGENSGDKVYFSSTIASNVQPQTTYNFDLGLPGGGNKWRGVYCQNVSASQSLSASQATIVAGTETQTTLDVRQGINSAAYPVARFENTAAGGSTYIETHGTNQGGMKMYRGGVVRATIDTGGNAFCMYNGTPTPANLGFMISSGKAEFKETTAHNFSGTKAQVNISASSGPAVRVDSTNAATVFQIENLTTTITSGSAEMLTMSNTAAPTTPSNAARIYAKSGEMYVMDTGGNETQISPHDEDGEWQYFSRNVKTGKVVRIRMEKMIRRLEEITGESFIEEI